MTQIQHRRRQLLAATALTLGAALAPPLVRAASLGRRVVIVGGSWGGLSAARHLRIAAPELDVVLLEKSPLFQSLPLSNPWIASLPDRKLLSGDYRAAASAFGYRFLHANVTATDREQRKVHSTAGIFL